MLSMKSPVVEKGLLLFTWYAFRKWQFAALLFHVHNGSGYSSGFCYGLVSVSVTVTVSVTTIITVVRLK